MPSLPQILTGNSRRQPVAEKSQAEGEETMTTTDAEARARIRQFMPPLMIILVSVPLVFGLIPRNGFYGIRVREAFASEASWYAINRLGSIALVGAALVWMAAAAYAPRPFVKPIGIAAIVLTLAVLVITPRVDAVIRVSPGAWVCQQDNYLRN